MTRRAAIALLHYTAPSVVGGVETIIGRHATLMVDAGHDVRIVAGRGQPTDTRVGFDRIRLADSGNARVRAVRVELDQGRVPADVAALTDELSLALRGAVAGVDVVIAHNVASMPINLPLTAALHDLSQQAARPHVVLWHHDVAAAMASYAESLHDGWPWDLIRAAWPGTTSVAISAARAAVYAQVTGLDRAEIRVIPNGIDPVDALGLHATTTRFLRERGILAAAPILLAPVRLNPRKNVELGVEVLAALRDRGTRAALVVTGALDPHDPASRAYSQRLHALAAARGVEDRFHVAGEWLGGAPPMRVVSDLYRVADALLLPSRDEGFGLPLLEAGLHRLPVFSADLPALREVAGPSAVLFAPDAPPEMIAALISSRLGDDAAYRDSLRTRESFDWQTIHATQIEPLIQELTGEPG